MLQRIMININQQSLKSENFKIPNELPRIKLKLNLIFENMLDEAYKEHASGIYSPGRSVVVGFRYGN